MTIQSFSQAGVQVSHQGQKPAPGSLGSTGNLRFKLKQGGTPRIGRFDVLRSRIGNLLARLKVAVSRATQEIRAQRKAVIQSRADSLRIGSLLGRLTASAKDGKAQRRIARELVQLCKQINKDRPAAGDGLGVLSGTKRQALSAHLYALNDVDLHALRLGALGQPGMRDKVLAQVESFEKQGDCLKEQAEAILSQIKAAVDQRLAESALGGPLAELDRALSPAAADGTIPPVNGQELADKLIKLSSVLAMVDESDQSFRLSRREDIMQECEAPQRSPRVRSMLDVYLGTLSRDDVQGLGAAFRADKLEAAQQALAQVGAEAESKQALAMLESLRAAVGSEMQARAAWEGIAARVDLARSSGDRDLAYQALCDTDALLAETEQAYGWVSKDMAEYARNVVGHARETLRDVKNNPNGPLNDASLRRLDPASLEGLRRSARLHALGLQLEASADAAQRRVLALGWQTVQGMNDVFQAMSGDPVDMAMYMQKLRELSRVEALRLQELNALRLDGSGSEKLEDLARLAVEELRRGLTPVQRQTLLSNMLQLKRQEEEFARAGQAVGDIVDYALVEQPALGESISVDDYKVGGRQISMQLDTTRRLLSSMFDALDEAFRLQGAGGPSSSSMSSGAGTLPDAFYYALQTQYEVAYDPQKKEAAVLTTDSARACLAPGLVKTPDPSAHIREEVTLPVGGAQKTFAVSRQFIADTVTRPSATFSVRGTGADGQLLSFTWPNYAGMDGETRKRLVGEAMDVLDQVAGPALEALTRMLNQQIYAGLLESVPKLGLDGPFRLEDGSVCTGPGGGQELHYDVVRDADGEFTIEFRARISPVNSGSTMSADGTEKYAMFNGEVSWVEAGFTLRASADGLQFNMVGLPQFRHHLEVVGFV